LGGGGVGTYSNVEGDIQRCNGEGESNTAILTHTKFRSEELRKNTSLRLIFLLALTDGLFAISGKEIKILTYV
jgi:hypothetical protein